MPIQTISGEILSQPLNDNFSYMATNTVYSIAASGTDTINLTYDGLTYFAGLKINMTVSATNTTAVSVNLNAIGAKDVKRFDYLGVKGALPAGFWHEDKIVQLEYDGTDFVYIDTNLMGISVGENNNVGIGITGFQTLASTYILDPAYQVSTLQLGGNSSFMAIKTVYSGSRTWYAQNISWKDTKFVHISNGKGSLYTQQGSHFFLGCPSAAAGADASTYTLAQFDPSGSITFPLIGTTASGANAFLDGADANNVLRSTSSAKYKSDILDITQLESEEVYGLRPITFKSKAIADDKTKRFYGFLAEEVHETSPRLVNYIKDKDTQKVIPDAVQYDRICVLLVAELKRLKLAVEALTTRIDDIEKLINKK